MDQVIIYRNQVGGIAMCVPTGEISITAVMEKDVPQNCGARIFNRDELPQNLMEFFMALEMPGTEIILNFDKAKNITRDRLRAEREPLFAPLDLAYMRALETGQDTTAILAEKQRLRDITQLVDACTTIEQLKALKAAA